MRDLEKKRAWDRAHGPLRNRAGEASYNNYSYRSRRDIKWAAKAKPCADCGVQYPPWVMKRFELAYIHRVSSVTKILAEIAKCDVVCANCHADRTYKRINT